MLPHESPAAENPYAAPQTPLQYANANGDPWQTPRARTSYFTVAFRIAVVLSIIGIVWSGVGLLVSGVNHDRWKELLTLGILSIYVFMTCLLVMMVLCSFVVGVDLILQYLGLRSPPPPSLTSAHLQRVEPDALFFTELANQHLEPKADKDL